MAKTFSDTVIIVKEFQRRYIISPTSTALLRECQDLYDSGCLDFSMAQVYVVMRKMSRRHTLDGPIGGWLRYMMRNSLCNSDFNRCDEGSFTQISLALQRKVLVRMFRNQIYNLSGSDIPISEAVMETFVPLDAKLEGPFTAGIWILKHLCLASLDWYRNGVLLLN